MRPPTNAPTTTQAEVEDALTHGHSLAYRRIGKLQIANRTFHHLADFRGAVFDEVILENVNFEAGISCPHAVFMGDVAFRYGTLGPARFRAARFRGKADFTLATFTYADFWRVLFAGPACFASAAVKGASGSKEPPGEANFSFAGFDESADFTDATFHGATYFVGTRFRSMAKFDQARFLASVGFVSRPAWACLVRDDIQDLVEGNWPGASPKELAAFQVTPGQLMDREHGLFTELVRAGVVKTSAEQPGAPKPEHVEYAEFTGDTSPDEILQRVKDSPFGALAAVLFETLRQPLTGPIFPRNQEAPLFFCGVTFTEQKPPFGPHFRSADLASCSFGACTPAKTELKHVRFEAVTWEEQRTLFGRRPALADERFAKTPADRDRLREQYQDLAAGYRAARDFARAEQFRYGAMEMERLNGNAWRTLHKYLNGHDTSFFLPAFWCALFLLAIFPALYLALGSVATIPEAVAHSLLLSKLVSGEAGPTWSPAELIVRGLEVLLVGASATAAGRVWKRQLEMNGSGSDS